MEQSRSTRSTINNCAMNYNSKVLTIPLVRCDDMINTIIKQEVIDEANDNCDNCLLPLSRPEGLIWTPNWQNFYLGSVGFCHTRGGEWRSLYRHCGLSEERCRPLPRFVPATVHIETDALKRSATPTIKHEVVNETNHNSDRLVKLRIIKQEVIDEFNDKSDNCLLQPGTICRPNEVNTIGGEIKIEKGLIDGYEFEGIVSNKSHTLEIINCMELGMASNLKKIASEKFQVHKQFHTGDNPQEHNICNKPSKVKTDLIKYVNTGEKRFKCDVCQKAFKFKSGLLSHEMIHTGVKPFKCDVCQRDFKKKSDLTKHSMNHTGLIPSKCDVCHKVFVRTGNLKRHIMKIHNGDRPHICHVCKKSFGMPGGLKKHMLIHTEEKSFKCDVCQKAFKFKSGLLSHEMIHTGVKPFKCDPFKCDVCQRDFKKKSDLTKHSMNHTGLTSFQCDVCHKAFVRIYNLKRHIMKIHNGDRPHMPRL
ncbi:zinc finger protein OZF-like [Aphis craccivora]|uniref:Zinc finger protein OZF-like n=1 Tax=Aphis craccivora TaxID=307492 RepID=A0A6G0YN56_APHCR|nr:zinc finger protein OZF-like [Aphis craccivora]